MQNAKLSQPEEELFGIQELAARLGVSARTLRFYEDQGLIEPRRVGSSRIYTRRDAARMQLILRGKRLGFSLRDVKEFLDLYDADPKHVRQTRALLVRYADRISELEMQKTAIEQTLGELRELERQAISYLSSVGEDADGDRLPPQNR